MSQNKCLRLSRISRRQNCFAFFVAVLILFGTHHPVFALAAFGLCCGAMLLGKQSFFISLMFFIMPMAGIFKLTPEETSLFTYLELLFVALHICKKRFRLTYGELLALFFGAYVVITANLYTSMNITRTIKLVINLMLIGYMAELDPEREHKQLFLYFTFGVILSSLMRFVDSGFFPITEYVQMQTESYVGMTTVRFSGLYPDPNFYSINLILGMCLLIVLYRRKELAFAAVMGLIALLVLFAGLTGSKSSFLMLLLPMVLLLCVCVQNRNYTAFFGCIFAIGLIVFFVGQGSIDIFDYVLHRMKNSTASLASFTTDRTVIWRSYFDFFGENPFRTIFGSGASIEILDTMGSHNTYIDLVFMLGIVGTVLYLLVLYFNIRKLRRRISRSFLNYSVLLTIVVMYMFLGELLQFDLPFHMVLAGMVWNLKSKKVVHTE